MRFRKLVLSCGAALVLGACVQPDTHTTTETTEQSDGAQQPAMTPPEENIGGQSTVSKTSRSLPSISLDVRVRSVSIRRDTVGVTYTVTNLRNSRESVLEFLVDAPPGIARIRLPSPFSNWDTSTSYRSRPAAVWSMLGLLRPGASSPELHFESVGIPGVLTYWARGKARSGSYDDDPDEDKVDSIVLDNPLISGMIQGKTVSVERWPSDRSVISLLKRLRMLTEEVCGPSLRWIADSNSCARLIAKLDQAESFRRAGQPERAQASLDDYTRLLSSPAVDALAERVSSSAYWLLKSNAEIIRSML